MSDRRKEWRYALGLPLDYRTVSGQTGVGVAIDMTSRTARVQLDRVHPISTALRLYVAWPVKLNNVTPLRLRLDAQIMEVDGARAVVTFRKYEFLTAPTRRKSS
jgi:hypothetical protein